LKGLNACSWAKCCIWKEKFLLFSCANLKLELAFQRTISILRESSNIGRIAPWNKDLDNPTNFLIDLSTNEGSEGAGSLETKKPRIAHDKNPTYPPPRYTAYAYKVCLQWYKT